MLADHEALLAALAPTMRGRRPTRWRGTSPTARRIVKHLDGLGVWAEAAM
jgi:hypothetical protein